MTKRDEIQIIMEEMNDLITECWESDDRSDLSRVANRIKEYNPSELSESQMISVLMVCFRIRESIPNTILKFYDECAVELENIKN